MKANDLSDAQTSRRQQAMMSALRRSDMGERILRTIPSIQLDEAFCQWRARDLRVSIIAQAKELLAGAPTKTLWFVTAVPSAGLSSCDEAPIACEQLTNQFIAAAKAVGSSAVVSVVELDFDADKRAWQATIHAVQKHVGGKSARNLTRTLRSALQEGDQRPAGAYRPVVTKQVTQLDPLLLYITKALALTSTTQRRSWRDADGEARSRKQSLGKRPLRQLLQHTLEHPLESRISIVNFEEIA